MTIPLTPFDANGVTRMTTTKAYDYLNRLTSISSSSSSSFSFNYATRGLELHLAVDRREMICQYQEPIRLWRL